jgi:Thaumatin family
MRRTNPARHRWTITGYLLGGAALAVVLTVSAVLYHLAGRPGPHPAAGRPIADAAHAPASTAPASLASPGASPSPARTGAPPAVVPRTGHRQVTFVNAVNQTIWVAGAQQTPQPALPVSGWVLPPGHRLTIPVPDRWNGRFWGRTGCTFDATGKGHCQTGDCAGLFQCKQYGAIPATLAEFNLNSWQNLDFYDVSMVDGSNLPMYINIAAGTTKDPISPTGCARAGCTSAVDCPGVLQIHAGGAMVGCESACGVLGGDQYCCRGTWAARSACDPTRWPVNYAAVFKTAEPFAYSYVDDDATSTFTCAGECGYRITFGLSP